MSAIFLEQAIVHYEVMGRGRPVLFLHGWVGSWRYWIPVMQVSSSTFRTYAIDLWGFGDSAREVSRYSLEQQLNLVDSFLEEMGIARLAVVGHGLGAVLAILYARRHPELVDRVMAAGCPLSTESINPRLRQAAPQELAEWLLERDPLADTVRLEVPKMDPKAIQASVGDLTETLLTGLLKDLKIACLLVHGSDDPAISAPRPDQLTDLPYMVHTVLFEQSGHFPMISEESKFSRLLGDFLALDSGDSPRELQLKEEWKRRVR
ncbi:MAG TPA: alpha/beta hydrolase [Anaerolineaceae bacterium]|nr:alpha/beta hydrolase [Anaerolineaceae bacterium]